MPVKAWSGITSLPRSVLTCSCYADFGEPPSLSALHHLILIVGAAITAARIYVAWERKTGRDMPCPYNALRPYDAMDGEFSVPITHGGLDRLNAEAKIQIMIQIVKIKQRPVQNERQLREVGRIYN